jgi:hypothetical protein
MRATGFAIAAALAALALVAADCNSDGDDDSAQQTPVPEAPFIFASSRRQFSPGRTNSRARTGQTSSI